MSTITTCKIVKVDGSEKPIPVVVVDGYCVDPSGKPFATREMLALTGVSQSIVSKKFTALTEGEKKAVLRIGKNPDGSTVVNLEAERAAKKAAREAADKAKRDAENAILTAHGYVWEKGTYYIDGYKAGLHNMLQYDGDFAPAWLLNDCNGKTVVAIVQGKEIFGSVDAILTELDAEKKAEANAECAAIAKFFETPCETPTETVSPQGVRIKEGQGFDPYGSGVEYIIEGEAAIWRLINNGGDGDDWARNNFATGGAGAIASRYPFDSQIVKFLLQ